MISVCQPYDGNLPLGWFIDYVNCQIGNSLNPTLRSLIAYITPLFTALFGLYFLLLSVGLLRGKETMHVMEFLHKSIAWALLIGIGFNYQTYNETVMPIATNLGNELNAILTNNPSMARSYDALFINLVDMLTVGMRAINTEISFTEPSTWVVALWQLFMVALKFLVLFVGIVPFVALAVSFTILANAGAQIVAALGPIFFGLAIFPATRQYFSSWINTIFSYTLIPALVSIVAVVATGVTMTILGVTAPLPGEPVSLVDVNLSNSVMAAIANFVFIFMLHQVASIASSLSAGGINAGMGNVNRFGRQASGLAGAGQQKAKKMMSERKKKNEGKEGGSMDNAG
ncbi:MAG: type IV secretion system protein [Halothiobacillaceae bacterium]|nr:type IV secretion system protein [Halothiobacillaceae bacterium]